MRSWVDWVYVLKYLHLFPIHIYIHFICGCLMKVEVEDWKSENLCGLGRCVAAGSAVEGGGFMKPGV